MFLFKHNQNGSIRLWFNQTSLICCLSPALRVPLLVRHPDTKELLVNFDPLIYEVIKESECMRKLHLDIPEFAKTLCLLRKKLKADHCTLKVSFKLFYIGTDGVIIYYAMFLYICHIHGLNN